MMIRVKKAEYLCDYKLKITFSDKKIKIVDFEEWINEGGIYLNPLKKVSYFKKVRMDNFDYSICWPNGADFSADTLYSFGKDLFSNVPDNSNKKVVKNTIRRSSIKIPR